MARSRRRPGAHAATPPEPRALRDARSIALLASPVRQEILDLLAAGGGESDVAAVAAELGRPADGLYYHFEKLRRGGLLERVDALRGRRYRIAARLGRAVWLDYDGDARARRAVARVIDGMLRITRRDFRVGLADPTTTLAGPRRELWASRSKGWVSPARLAEANRLLARLEALLIGPRRRGAERMVSLSFVLAPVVVRPKRRAGAAASGRSARPPTARKR